MKLLITILTSYNECILYESYKTVKNQINHNIDYDIFIIVNSLNPDYYNNVMKKFIHEKIKIIETISNGKPGKGHNSLIHIFRNNQKYDYLLTIDGDDFMYPFNLHQLQKLLIYQPDIEVGGNEDIISNYKEVYNNTNSIDVNHKYFVQLEPNIPIHKEYILHNKGTPFRLCMINRSIFEYEIDKLYCEDCTVFDDYLLFLHILHLSYTTSLKIYTISLKNIYIYYKAHISSVCYQNSTNNEDNIEVLINKFPLLLLLEKENFRFKLPMLYVSNYTLEDVKYTICDGSINYNYNDFMNSKQYRLNLNHLMYLSNEIFNCTVDFVNLQISKLTILSFVNKKKLYLLLENFIMNDYYKDDLIIYLLQVSNNINYIALDIIDKISQNFDLKSYLDQSHIDYFNNNDYIYCYLKLLYEDNFGNEKYHYFYDVCAKLNINSYKIQSPEIELPIHKKTIILLDSMNIDYDLDTPYKRGIGGTQSCYIYLAITLSQNYNVIILNKKKEKTFLKFHNIYIIPYETLSELCIYINNIRPSIIIYNFIDYGKLLRENIVYEVKLYMYEHITVYSNFKLKQKSDYYNYYDQILFVSNDQKNDYLKYCNVNTDKISILYNGLSSIFQYNSIQLPILEYKELSIVYCSNPQRGLDNFLYIFPLLKSRYPLLKLKIFSSLGMYDIEDNESLQLLYKKLEDIDGIEFKKCVSQIELKEELNRALLFIYPTYVSETFCNSCIEAASCGCKIIATKIGALNEVIGDYAELIDVNIEKYEHPYYEIIDQDYIQQIINKTEEIINQYINKSDKLESDLRNQIDYVKKKYNWENYKNIF